MVWNDHIDPFEFERNEFLRQLLELGSSMVPQRVSQRAFSRMVRTDFPKSSATCTKRS
jgi:hypothetical protein